MTRTRERNARCVRASVLDAGRRTCAGSEPRILQRATFADRSPDVTETSTSKIAQTNISEGDRRTLGSSTTESCLDNKYQVFGESQDLALVRCSSGYLLRAQLGWREDAGRPPIRGQYRRRLGVGRSWTLAANRKAACIL